VFRTQTSGRDGESLGRLSIKPLCIIDNAQHGLVGGELGQETQESEAHEQSIGRRTGKMSERHTKSIAMRRRELIKRVQGRHAQLLRCGKREFLLGFVSDSAEHFKRCSRFHGVVQQGGLANPRLPADHDRAAVTCLRGAKDPIESVALASSPE
jgi:hypothetical protein